MDESAVTSILPGNAQAVGRRAEQQDAFAISDLGDAALRADAGALCVVCDGMGGHAAGGDAARAAVAAFLRRYVAPRRDRAVGIAERLDEALAAANDAVGDVATLAGDSGSTLIAAVLHDDGLRWIGVGDSRLLLLRDGRLHRVNREHRHRGDLLRAAADGEMDWEEALHQPLGEHLTSSLGEDRPPRIDRSLRPLPLRAGDQVYLVTDGLYRSVDERALLDVAWPAGATGPASPEIVCPAWVALAIAAGLPDQDNATAAGLALAIGDDARLGAASRTHVRSDTEPEPPAVAPTDTVDEPGSGTASARVERSPAAAPAPRSGRAPGAVALIAAAAAGAIGSAVALRGFGGESPAPPAASAAPVLPLAHDRPASAPTTKAQTAAGEAVRAELPSDAPGPAGAATTR